MIINGKEQTIQWVKRFYDKIRRKEKSKILDVLQRQYGMHRKTAIRLMAKGKPGRPAKFGKRGRKSVYACPRFRKALTICWKSCEMKCGKLLKSAIPEWLAAIEEHKGQFDEDVRTKLLKISASSIDRILKPERLKHKRGPGGTKPGTILRTEIPIRTDFFEVDRPGYVEADTVAHCGGSMAGSFAWSLTLVDIYSAWTENRAIWGKQAVIVMEKIKEVQSAVPFEFLGFDCDNGSEFLNHHLIRHFGAYQQKQQLFRFTRSRPYKKNDNAHVEQKNWSHVRKFLGYERFEFPEIVELLNDLYANEYSLLNNHFYPTFKLSHKERIKSKMRRIYEKEPKTPYRRIMESEHVPDDTKRELEALHKSLNPLVLKEAVEKKKHEVFKLLRKLRRETLKIA